MLENSKFVEWANENLVVVIGHSETEHPAETEDEKGNKVPGCPLYPGLTCEEHRAIPGECRSPADGLPKLESANGMPNSWFMTPDGTVTAIEGADQLVAGKIEELATELQKQVGKHLTWKKYEKYRDHLAATDEALGKDAVKEAIKALQKVEKDSKKLPDGLNGEVDKRIEAINAKATELLVAIKDGAEEQAAKLKAANKLRAAAGLRFKRGYLPVVEEIKAWIKEAKAAGK